MKKCVNCGLIGMVVVIILALTYSINLGVNQLKGLIEMNNSLDSIIQNVKLLEAEGDKLEKENQEFKKLEDNTAEEMENLN